MSEMNNRYSIFQRLGLPQAFGVIILTLGVILVLSPYLSDTDLGIFKVPLLSDSTQDTLRWLGPIVLALFVLLFIPFSKRKQQRSSDAAGDTVESGDGAPAVLELGGQFKQPSIVWRLPRGFILLEDIVMREVSSWATVAYYYSYDGTELGGTHYHESYDWGRNPDRRDKQRIKLRIPIGDWRFAQAPIYLMMEIREGRVSVKENGEIEGNWIEDPRLATIHSPGTIPLPKAPDFYRGLAASGGLRDIATEASDLSEVTSGSLGNDGKWDRLVESAKGLRREARLQIHELLPDSHPAIKNLEEVIEKFRNDRGSIGQWLREFAAAVSEAASCVEKLRQTDRSSS